MGQRLAHTFAHVLVAVLVLTSGSYGARAQEPAPEAARGPLALHWVRLSGTEACIAGDALARAVETKLQRNVFPAARDASILIEGHVAKTADGYQAELHMTDPKGASLGSRSLSSLDTSCRELSEMLAVVLAVMIDPDAAKRPPSALPSAPGTPAQEKAKEAASDRNDVLAFTRVLLGLSQKPLVGFGGAYERALGAAGGLRIEAVFFLENTDDLSGTALPEEAKTVANLSYAGLAYCPLWLASTRVRFSGCGGLELGAVAAHDDQFPDDHKDATGLWLSASASLRLAIKLIGRLQAHVGASLVGALGRRLFVDVQGKSVAVLPDNPSVPLGGALDLGLGARF